MIVKKPYAFLIKNFRYIHFVLVFLMSYLAFKTSSIVSFFSDYVHNGSFNQSSEEIIRFVNGYMFIIVILVIIISAIIYLLMKWKKKNRLLYISISIFYILLFVGFLVYFNLFNDIFNTTLDVRVVRAYRDIIIMLYAPQFFFIFYSLIRAIGFDVKKFDFKKDLLELDIAEEDQEEVELTFGENLYKYKRVIHKFFREFKYYFIENKFFFTIICSVIGLVLSYIVIVDLTVYFRSYKQSEFFTVDGIVFNVIDSYVSDKSYDGSIINKDKKYVVVKTGIDNTTNNKEYIKTDNISLVINKNVYSIDYSKGNYFIDLGDSIKKKTLMNGNGNEEYLMIFEVPVEENLKGSIFRILEKVNVIDGKISSKNKDVRLDMKDYISNNKVLSYAINEDISINNQLYGEINLKVLSYDISSSYSEPFKYCTNTCFDGIKVIKPTIYGNGTRDVMKVSMSYEINKNLFINKYIKNSSDVLGLFGYITYKIGNSTKVGEITSINTYDLNNGFAYIEIPGDVRSADEIFINLVLRTNTYSIKIK